MNRDMKRFVAIGVIVLFATLILAFDLQRFLTLDTLRENRALLKRAVSEHYLLSASLFCLVYVLVVAISLPGASILTVTGGYLFGAAAGAAFAVLAATVGAVLLFVAVSQFAGDSVRQRVGPYLKRMEHSFRANAFSSILFLRLLPIFPFWAVNLVAAVAGVPMLAFALATVIGIVPSTFAFAAFGEGIGELLASGNEISLSDALSPSLIVALVVLAVLALAPIMIRSWPRK